MELIYSPNHWELREEKYHFLLSLGWGFARSREGGKKSTVDVENTEEMGENSGRKGAGLPFFGSPEVGLPEI